MRELNKNKQEMLTGIVLALVSVFIVLFMINHPDVVSQDINKVIEEVQSEARMNRIVHGVIVFFLMLINICLTCYGKARGFDRTRVLYGLIVYWVGTVVMVLAALLDGVVGPSLAEHYHQATSSQAEVFRGIHLLTSRTTITFAYFSFCCWSVGIGFFAFDMACQNKAIRLFGIVSLLAVITILLSFLSGFLTLSITGATITLIVVSTWQFGIGCLLCYKS